MTNQSEDFLDEWATHLTHYATPTVLKHSLLRPFFENRNLDGPILDIGCGPGYFSEMLSARNFAVIGVDAHQDSFPLPQYGANYLKMHATHLKFQDESFATVLLINVITVLKNHADRIQALAEAKRVKTPNGELYLTQVATYQATKTA